MPGILLVLVAWGLLGLSGWLRLVALAVRRGLGPEMPWAVIGLAMFVILGPITWLSNIDDWPKGDMLRKPKP